MKAHTVEKNIILDKRDLYMSITPVTMKSGETYHYVWWYFKNEINKKFRKLCVEREEVDNLLKDLVIQIRAKMFV